MADGGGWVWILGGFSSSFWTLGISLWWLLLAIWAVFESVNAATGCQTTSVPPKPPALMLTMPASASCLAPLLCMASGPALLWGSHYTDWYEMKVAVTGGTTHLQFTAWKLAVGGELNIEKIRDN